MRKLLIGGMLFIFATTPCLARSFGGYECTVDCSGHKAGYEWAEAKDISDEESCEAILRRSPNRNSFYEGCLAYVEDPARGADDDDDETGMKLSSYQGTRDMARNKWRLQPPLWPESRTLQSKFICTENVSPNLPWRNPHGSLFGEGAEQRDQRPCRMCNKLESDPHPFALV